MSERRIFFPNGTYLTTAIWDFASSNAYFAFRDDALLLFDKWRQKPSPEEEPWYQQKRLELVSLFTDRQTGACDIDPDKILSDIWYASKDVPPGEIRVTLWGHYTFGACNDGRKPMLVVLKACVQATAAGDRAKMPKESFVFIDNFAVSLGDVPC
jgi:hypothetical protein